MTLDSVVVGSSGQVSCDLDGEAAILNLETGTYYGLDRVGARIWNLLETPTKVAAIRDTIVQEFDVDVQRCEQDVLSLLERLSAEGLITLAH